MELVDLYHSSKINEWEYRVYLLFEVNDIGRDFLKKSFEGINLEEPPSLDNESSFAWQDGRRSIWRDIKHAINKVNTIIEDNS